FLAISLIPSFLLRGTSPSGLHPCFFVRPKRRRVYASRDVCTPRIAPIVPASRSMAALHRSARLLAMSGNGRKRRFSPIDARLPEGRLTERQRTLGLGGGNWSS